MLIPSLFVWLAANPLATTVLFVSGTMFATWFISTYWYVLLTLLLLWAIPKVLEILRGLGIDFSKTESLVQWMDGKAKKSESFLKNAFRLFKKGIRWMGSTYIKKNTSIVTRKHQVLIDMGNDQGQLITREEEMRWDDVPNEIRAELLRHRLDSFTVDDYKVIDQRVKQRAQEENMPELMEMVC
ncbi:MAG: hypothetical protein ACRC10_00750 [Thermoguttaceae bacterium]